MPTGDEAAREEANRLYWDSDASVAEIAETLGLSRRALYDAVQPVPAGMPCPECGADMVFLHRLARSNREAVCPRCGTEARVPEREEPVAADAGRAAPAEPAARAMPRPERAPAPARRGAGPAAEEEEAPTGDAGPSVLDSRPLLLTGAALTGLALGVAVALLARRR